MGSRSTATVRRRDRPLQRTRPSRSGCNRAPSRAGSLSLSLTRCDALFDNRTRILDYDNMPTNASDLLRKHIETLVDDPAQWQTLIADEISWELAYAPSIGHPARLSGREEVNRHVTWFRGAVDNFRFFELTVYPIANSEGAVAEVKAEATIKSTGRVYRQDYVVFLRAADGKIVFLREYFDPVRAAKAMDLPIVGLESRSHSNAS